MQRTIRAGALVLSLYCLGCGDALVGADSGGPLASAPDVAEPSGGSVFGGGAGGPFGADTTGMPPDASSDAADSGLTPDPDATTANDAAGPDDPGGPDATATPDAAPDATTSDVPAWVDPDSVCGYGSIYGIICSASTQTFVDGATVWIDTTDCDGNPLHIETTSDGDGYYTLEGVPNGLQTVQIKRDDFEKTHTVSVQSGKVSDVTGVGHKECYQFVDPDTCTPGKQNINVEAKVVGGVADIVWFIDTSGSMDEEAKYLQDNINAFATFIGNQAVDFHVVLIAEGFDICVPPPLGGPNCTDGPSFRHVHQSVDSHDGLEQVIDTYDQYKDFLRPDATTNFIAVTDDNSDENAGWFKNEVSKKVDPGFSSPFVFHSVVGKGTLPFVGCFGAASVGSVYLQLSAETGGATFPICNKDWSSMFGAMAETVVETVQTTCGYAVPNPAAIANATSLTLKHDGGGFYVQVAGPEACGTSHGFYTEGGDQLFLCPKSCTAITGGVLELITSCQ